MKKFILFAFLLGWTTFLADGKMREKRSVVRLETSAGNIRIALSDETPAHRNNFLKLTEEGYFNGTLFHRVVRDFIIQGGDPESRNAPKGTRLGSGGPDYLLAPEIALPWLYHKRGAVGMARESDDNNPDRLSHGSQFYIVWGQRYKSKELDTAWSNLRNGTYGDWDISRDMELEYLTTGGAPQLDGQYTVFGEVIEGLDIVEKIQNSTVDSCFRPISDIIIYRAIVEQKSKKAVTNPRRQYRPSLY